MRWFRWLTLGRFGGTEAPPPPVIYPHTMLELAPESTVLEIAPESATVRPAR